MTDKLLRIDQYDAIELIKNTIERKWAVSLTLKRIKEILDCLNDGDMK